MSFSINNITKFDVEITNKCNARCPGCIRTVNGDSHPLLKQNITEWSLEDFINIFPSKLVNGNEFMFGGTVDDPLMNKNIVPIVEYILENDGILEIQTNTLKVETKTESSEESNDVFLIVICVICIILFFVFVGVFYNYSESSRRSAALHFRYSRK